MTERSPRCGAATSCACCARRKLDRLGEGKVGGAPFPPTDRTPGTGEAAIHSGTTALTGLIGWPVAHSLSPRLHTYWLRLHHIDGAYLPLPVREGEAAIAINGLRAAGFRGLNVTIPHKQAAFEACDSVAPFARQAGAVNTIVFSEGHTHGTNTDGEGFLRSLADAAVAAAGGPVLVLGAGGAARAIAAALREAGAAVTLASRRPEAATALAASLGARALAWTAIPSALPGTALLINTTAGGMHGQPALDLSLATASDSLAVADIVYTPPETPLLAQARAQGLRTVGGLGMLLHQAALSFHAWFGVQPVVDEALRTHFLSPSPPLSQSF